MKKTLLIIIVMLVQLCAWAQKSEVEFVPPVRFPMLLAGNFGEPRHNHFHQGIDVKTLHSVNKTICSVAEGYVSRITIGLGGFGNALYITHPNGVTSVYCHLNKFASPIQKYAERYMHGHRLSVADVSVAPGALPVAAGEPVALSGNTGSSEGPHLHMEFHRTVNDNLIDPLPYFMQFVRDTVAPVAHGIIVMPQSGGGVVEQSMGNRFYAFSGHTPGTRIRAWGQIGLAVWANDYASDSYNRLGVRRMKLLVDGREAFCSDLDEFSPLETRCVNSWSAYDYFMRSGHAYLRLYAEPGNVLRLLHGDEHRGVVVIDQPRDYNCEIVLTDVYGNESRYRVVISGAPFPIETDAPSRPRLDCRRLNVYQCPGMQVELARGTLYNDVDDELCESMSRGRYSRVYALRSLGVPLGGWATMSIAPYANCSVPLDKLYIEMIRGGKGVAMESTADNGFVVARVRELGASYTLVADTVSPRIVPIGDAGWGGMKVVRYNVSDSQTAVKSFRAWIDGKYAAFVLDRRTGGLVCNLNGENLQRGRNHVVRLEVTDMCGNRAVDQRKFYY